MVKPKIVSRRPVALIGGGALRNLDLDAVMADSEFLIAADGGADRAVARGYRPDLVIGDLDSLSPDTRAVLPADAILRDDDQNSTDFDKCLARIDAPMVLAVGFLGKRVDHQLAAFNSVVREPAGRIVLIGARDVCVHLPRRLALDLAAETRFSLFPMRPVTGKSTGLEWNIDGLRFAPGGQIGTSNRATGRVTLSMEGNGMLLILPRRCLDAVRAALAGR